MSAITGIVAGLAAVAGVAALYRFASRRAGDVGKALDEALRPSRGDAAAPAILDFERDPESGVYRSK